MNSTWHLKRGNAVSQPCLWFEGLLMISQMATFGVRESCTS